MRVARICGSDIRNNSPQEQKKHRQSVQKRELLKPDRLMPRFSPKRARNAIPPPLSSHLKKPFRRHINALVGVVKTKGEKNTHIQTWARKKERQHNTTRQKAKRSLSVLCLHPTRRVVENIRSFSKRGPAHSQATRASTAPLVSAFKGYLRPVAPHLTRQCALVGRALFLSTSRRTDSTRRKRSKDQRPQDQGSKDRHSQSTVNAEQVNEKRVEVLGSRQYHDKEPTNKLRIR